MTMFEIVFIVLFVVLIVTVFCLFYWIENIEMKFGSEISELQKKVKDLEKFRTIGF